MSTTSASGDWVGWRLTTASRAGRIDPKSRALVQALGPGGSGCSRDYRFGFPFTSFLNGGALAGMTR
jgi:hypothetical protein